MSQPGYPSQFPQQPTPSHPYGQAPGQIPPPGYAPPPPSGDNPVGLIAMICGLLSFVMGCPLSIAAIILGFMGMKKEPKGMATAGLILGIVTLTLNVLVGCFILAIYGAAFGVVAAGAAGVSMLIPYEQTNSAFQGLAQNLETHKTDNGSYPDEATGTSMVQGTLDGWNHQIVYRREEEDYVLVSPGPDGLLDNDDDIPFYPYEYSPPFQVSDIKAEDYADIADPTEKAITMGSDIIGGYYDDSPSLSFPTDAEGQALIDHLVDEWGNKLVYRQTEGGDSYLVISKGPDGVLDTDDDLNDESY